MSEVPLAAVYVSCLFIDGNTGQWTPMSSGYTHLSVYQNQQDGSYRIVAFNVNENSYGINSPLAVGVSQYSKATDTFHQFADSSGAFGFNFYSADDANTFMAAIQSALAPEQSRSQSVASNSMGRIPASPMAPAPPAAPAAPVAPPAPSEDDKPAAPSGSMASALAGVKLKKTASQASNMSTGSSANIAAAPAPKAAAPAPSGGGGNFMSEMQSKLNKRKDGPAPAAPAADTKPVASAAAPEGPKAPAFGASPMNRSTKGLAPAAPPAEPKQSSLKTSAVPPPKPPQDDDNSWETEKEPTVETESIYNRFKKDEETAGNKSPSSPNTASAGPGRLMPKAGGAGDTSVRGKAAAPPPPQASDAPQPPAQPLGRSAKPPPAQPKQEEPPAPPAALEEEAPRAVFQRKPPAVAAVDEAKPAGSIGRNSKFGPPGAAPKAEDTTKTNIKSFGGKPPAPPAAASGGDDWEDAGAAAAPAPPATKSKFGAPPPPAAATPKASADEDWGDDAQSKPAKAAPPPKGPPTGAFPPPAKQFSSNANLSQSSTSEETQQLPGPKGAAAKLQASSQSINRSMSKLSITQTDEDQQQPPAMPPPTNLPKMGAPPKLPPPGSVPPPANLDDSFGNGSKPKTPMAMQKDDPITALKQQPGLASNTRSGSISNISAAARQASHSNLNSLDSSSAGAPSSLSPEMQALKKELMFEMRKELAVTKQEIIDSFRMEMVKLAKALAADD